MSLFHASTVNQVRNILKEHIKSFKIQRETVDIISAYNRVLAEDIVSDEDIPAFNRSTVDGFAVKASDTFGSNEALPSLLELVGEVFMGKAAKLEVKSGQAVKIPTGGMLPEGADAVVMLEYTQFLDDTTLCIEKPVAPGENVVFKGDDIKNGSVLLKKGHTLRPQDLGALSGIGKVSVQVAKPPKVAVISTGDEIKPAEEKILNPGEVRDINTYAICGQVLRWGGEPVPFGIIKDSFDDLYTAVDQALKDCDLIILSGGSSVGVRDHTEQVIEKFGEPGVLAHGLPIKPGKPTIVAVVKGKPVIGLPGHPVSAMVIFEVIVRPIISMLLGRRDEFGGIKVFARMSRNISSAAGREDFIRVKLEERQEEIWAVPILGKSGLISTMVMSHGLARIPTEKQGILEGELVEVELF